jgi:hypothetical protein
MTVIQGAFQGPFYLILANRRSSKIELILKSIIFRVDRIDRPLTHAEDTDANLSKAKKTPTRNEFVKGFNFCLGRFHPKRDKLSCLSLWGVWHIKCW